MAKGTVTGEFVVRSGSKRELQFVLKSQSEICGGESLGRTRGSKNSNGVSRSSHVKKTRRGSGLKVGMKKIRLSKNEEVEKVVMSDTALEEDEGKSDVVDVDEVKDLFSDYALVESMSEDKGQEENVEIENGFGNVVMNEELHEKGTPKVQEVEKEISSVIDREIVVACPADLSVLDKMVSRSCQVKLERGLVHEKPCRRLTRSMSKVEGIKSEEDHMNPEKDARDIKSEVNAEEGHVNPEKDAKDTIISEVNAAEDHVNPEKDDTAIISEVNAEEDHVNPEKDAKDGKDNCVDVSTSVTYGREEELHEQNSADPCLGRTSGSSQMSGPSRRVDEKTVKVNDVVDKPLRRFTRSLVKQESDSVNPSLENKTEPEDLGEVDVHASDVVMDDGFQSPAVTTHNKRGRPRKFLRNFPAKLKEILDSGILEGLTVYYLRGAKMREAGTRGLKGVIKGLGVLCFCSACKGIQVVSPGVYEVHASSTNKRPPEYILLESGFTLREVMNACKETPLATLEEKLCGVVGPTLKKSGLCLNCQGPMVEPCDTKSLVLCKSCLEDKEPELHTSPSKENDTLKGSSTPNVASKTILSRSKLSPRQCNRREQATRKSPEPGMVPGSILSESKSSSIKSNSHGKLTRKDVRLHKLVFEDDILPDGAEVGYFVAGKKLLVGYKKGFGIHCSCCNKVVSPSSFEAHAGCASRRKPFQHIYTTNGVSLHELSVALLKDQRFSVHENDDLCTICKDGGDLLCCDTCPRSYHKVCASLPSLPTERWSCKCCVNMVEREKFVDRNLNAIAAGRVEGVDAIAEITKRCIRIVSSFESELPSVCVLCRGHSFCKLGFNSRTVIICDQCEKEFHVGCLKEHNIADLQELPEEKWFCSQGCKKINTSLGNLIVHGEEKLSNNILDFIRKKQKPNEENCPDDNTTPDIRWRVLSGKLTSSDDTKSLLAKAVSILHERFDPISESGTRGDLIPAMVYGRQTKGQDFSGMYCTMLAVDEVIVSVGVFRVFGSELAELPLVATSKDSQGQGYFQCLFACIQRLLGFLNVKHIVLPAADEAKSIWTNKFGFTTMTEDEVKEYRKDYSVMIFHGTSMLRKAVPDPKAMSKPEDNMEE
ncbi:Increased DNA methylation 1 [Cardamine amara subsp. amara]|uniref:Increased DNA methylation 1 n=1 Tax=Cardamine amara subsp. amara TaxID=228776 RepID=A0ABD0Z8M3_CARAN